MNQPAVFPTLVVGGSGHGPDNSDVSALVENVLALGLFNHIAGYDVDADIVFDFVDDMKDRGDNSHPLTADGFRAWLMA